VKRWSTPWSSTRTCTTTSTSRSGLAPPRGILLVGPSGTGKTALARALSGEKQIPLIAIDGPQLYSKWLGESEKALREVFKKRGGRPLPAVLHTIDAIAPRLGADDGKLLRGGRLSADSQPAACVR